MQHSQKHIIQALLTAPTIEAAAAQAGVARSTIYRAMKRKEFRNDLDQARRESFLLSIAYLHGQLGKYIKHLEELADTASLMRSKRKS